MIGPWGVWLACWFGLWAGSAGAHDLRPGAVALQEQTAGVFLLRLTPPQDGSTAPVAFVPQWPAGCEMDAGLLRCQPDLGGELVIPGLGQRRVKTVVAVAWADGERFEALLLEGQERVEIRRGGGAPTLSGFARLGFDHVLGGLDHLCFVLGLALVARRFGPTAWAVSGFTVAHSITLGATSMGWVRPPGAATELIIAGSVLLLAVEAARPASARPTLTARAPWLVAGLFGLVHGFGFAGALAEIGLPEGGRLWALLGFNLGVELGQLSVLGLAALGALAWTRWVPARHNPRRLLAYTLGLPAGVWTVARLADWAGQLA